MSKISYTQMKVSYSEARLWCDCGGEMKYMHNGVLLCNPPRYQHQCEECEEIENVRGTYYPSMIKEFKTCSK